MQGWIYDVYTQQSGCEGVWLQGLPILLTVFAEVFHQLMPLLCSTPLRDDIHTVPHPESPHLVHGIAGCSYKVLPN